MRLPISFPAKSRYGDFQCVTRVSQRIRTLNLSRGEKGIVIVPLFGIQKLLVPAAVVEEELD